MIPNKLLSVGGRNLFPVLLGLLILAGCAGGGQQEDSSGSYQENVKSMVEIQTYDRNGYDDEKGFGFYVAPDLVVTNLEWLKGAYRANITTLSSDKSHKVKGYKAYDLDRNLVLLEVSGNHSDFIDVEKRQDPPDSLYTLNVRSGKLYVRKDKAVKSQEKDSAAVWAVSDNMEAGKPAFTLDHVFTGIVQFGMSNEANNNQVLAGKWLAELVGKQLEEAESIYDLRLKSNKEYISHENVRGFRIETNKGNITIR